MLFLFAYAAPIVFPDMNVALASGCNAAQLVVWAIFGLDLIWRVAHADSKGRYLLHHWLDVAVLAVPMLRPLRLLRAVSLASLVARRVPAGSALRLSVAIRTVTAALLIWLISALAITDAERGGAGAIQSFGAGLWWSLTTITTVGYGDMFPVTLTGRIIAGLLMLTGIGLLSIATGTIASWFVEKLNATVEGIEEDTRQIEDLRAEVEHLRTLLEAAKK